jgi:chromosome segregation ATPase
MAEEPTAGASRRRTTSREQIEGLVRENRTLGETLEGLHAQISSLEKSTQEAVQARQEVQEEAAEAQRKTEELQQRITELQDSNQQLEARVRRLSSQVENTPLQPLTPEEGSALFNRTLQSLRNISGFEVRNADLTLKLATARLGDEPVLVLPEPGTVDPTTLHELKFAFRSGADS